MLEKTGEINNYQDQIRTQKLILAAAEKKIEDLKSKEESLRTVINSNQAIMEDRNKELKALAKSEKDVIEQLSTKKAELAALQEKHQRLVDEVTVIRNQIGEKDESLSKRPVSV
jgi:chromosome segregation ATPase